MKKILVLGTLVVLFLLLALWYPVGMYTGIFGVRNIYAGDSLVFRYYTEKTAADRHLKSLNSESSSFPFPLILCDQLNGFGDLIEYYDSTFKETKPNQPKGATQVFSFVDQAGVALEIRVEHGSAIEEDTLGLRQACEITAVSDVHDMREVIASENGNALLYVRGYISYVYDKDGSLRYIFWHHNDMRIIICERDSTFEKYPYKKDTLVSKLLDQDTAMEAVTSINAAIK